MKKKLHPSGESAPAQQSADYVVGQVSGSLFQKDSASSSSLSALFSTAAPAAPLLFRPAPKPVQQSSETKEQQKEAQEAPRPKGQASEKKKKKPSKEKSAADQKLENRESGLQNADEDERGQASSGKKRKREAGESHVEHWVMKRQRLKANREEEAMKRKRTVFVGNLPVSCTKKTLRCLFKDKGSIESIRFRSVVREDPSMSQKVATIKRKCHPKKQSMNAYVVFTDEEGVTRALERNGTEIEKDFHIRVDRAAGGSSHDHRRSVFAGNLSFEISESAFRRHFEECCPVEAVRLVRDPKSGLGKGFGYVLFESADSVQLALKLDGSKLEGRSVRVKRSVKKEKLKTKTDGKGAPGRNARSPKVGGAKAPARGSRREKGASVGGFKASRSARSSASFKGEMTDPNKKAKKKKPRTKARPNKTVHI